ncbi:alpha/beta fold hydrolase [Spirosoma radiotolerans]|uniref:Alpha/beta hydrolase n=1 Tax=Spirosoma radiotolerans TaxID=1379870 RepID=A0A0E3V6P4_9BACT|nr:alpha/beta hydrolase [Spirosoma radiotolerans]AKD54716.1 alpha/beta hydrolase [Spirosoma radiotolerans]
MSQLPIICLIHGHGVDASIWESIYADLALGHSVLTPDFARLSVQTTIEGYAEELYDVLQAAEVEKAVLIGHSMGGYMALALAEHHPELVQGLVLYHSTATADDEAKREARQQVIKTLQTEGTTPFIQKQMPKMVAPAYSPEKTEELITRFLTLPAEALAAGVTAIAGRPDRTAVLRNADFPVLLVLGREDQLIPYDKTAQLADLSTQIRVAVIEQAGHLSMVEQPEAATQVIRSFVDGL